ncbi:MAG: hypothetical protein AVDCRST_MAG67-3681, partial [uncultured Solirubrobacteraceae bacterium]
ARAPCPPHDRRPTVRDRFRPPARVAGARTGGARVPAGAPCPQPRPARRRRRAAPRRRGRPARSPARRREHGAVAPHVPDRGPGM